MCSKRDALDDDVLVLRNAPEGLDDRLPELEWQKKAAAAARNYKEAGAPPRGQGARDDARGGRRRSSPPYQNRGPRRRRLGMKAIKRDEARAALDAAARREAECGCVAVASKESQSFQNGAARVVGADRVEGLDGRGRPCAVRAPTSHRGTHRSPHARATSDLLRDRRVRRRFRGLLPACEREAAPPPLGVSALPAGDSSADDAEARAASCCRRARR